MTKTENLTNIAKNSTNPLRAIRLHCWVCYGEGEPDDCVDENCALFDFRKGKNTRKTVRVLTAEQKEKQRRMLDSVRKQSGRLQETSTIAQN